MKSIPVERPQDIATSGDGKIIIESNTKIIGFDTWFTKQFEVGDGIVGSIGPKYNIEEIVSDTELKVKTYEKDESVFGQ